MKTKTLQLAGVLALLAVIGKYYAVPAYAQARAALVQNRDEPGRNAYFQIGSCSQVTFSFCQVTFPAVPAGKRLVITHVSALNLMPAAGTIGSVDLRVLNGAIKAFYPITSYPGVASTVNYPVESNGMSTFEAGEAPQFITFVNNNANFQLVAT